MLGVVGGRSLRFALVLLLLVSVTGGFVGDAARAAPPPTAGAEPSAPASPDELLETVGELPARFEANQGQADDDVAFLVEGARHAFYFTAEQVVLSFVGDAGGDAASEAAAVGLAFRGANPEAVVEGVDALPGVVNYLRGDDPSQWHTDVAGYGGVVYRDLWPGIDAQFREADGELKYEFHVAPGADPADVALAYAGADALAVDGEGGLVVDTPLGALRDAPPVSWQTIDGERVPVDSAYELVDGEPGAFGFTLGAFDPAHGLVIDPGVEYATFLGGSSNDEGADVAVDADGNAYVVGITQSTDFPTTAGAHDRTFNGGVMDVFVAKLSADGSALAYGTYLGGTPASVPGGGSETPIDQGRAIAVDGSGNAYITGQTTSDDFPTTSGAFQRQIAMGTRTANDAFVAKLNSNGALVYSTFFGGASQDDGRDITVDAAGNAYIVGETSSRDLPVTSGAFQTTRGDGSISAFLVKLNPTGSGLVYSTYLGAGVDSNDNTIGNGVAIDGSGNAYVFGATRAQDFPTTTGAFMETHPGGDFIDLFTTYVTKFTPDGSDLVYSTFLGGTKREAAGKIDVNDAGNAYVTGATLSPEFPTTPGAHDTTFEGTSEAYVVKLTPDGSDLVFSTFLAGAGGPIALDADDNAWLGGGRNGDVAVTLLSADGSAVLDEATFGGSNGEGARGLALDPAGNVYVTGKTLSDDFPTTPGAFDTTFAGDPSIFWGDAFVAKLSAGTGGGDGGGGGTDPDDPDPDDPDPDDPDPDDPDDPEPPPPATRTDTFSGRIDKNQTRTHQVSVEAPGTVDLNLNWDESRVALTLRVRDAAGNVVFLDNSSSRPKSGSFEAAAAGTYRVDLINTVDRRADYTLSVTSPVASTTPPPTTPSPTLSALSLNPTSVEGGGSSTGTATLTDAAPSGGAAVTLASDNTGAATVPSSVTVPAGQTSVTFTVTTTAQQSDQSATISGAYGGETRTATLTVTAPAPTDPEPPPPPPEETTRTDTFSGRIDKNQTRTHQVSVEAPGTVDLNLNWDESRVALTLRVRDAAGNVVFLDNSSSRPKSGSFEAAAAGTYRVDLINTVDRRADYTLSVTSPLEATTATTSTSSPMLMALLLDADTG